LFLFRARRFHETSKNTGPPGRTGARLYLSAKNRPGRSVPALDASSGHRLYRDANPLLAVQLPGRRFVGTALGQIITTRRLIMRSLLLAGVAAIVMTSAVWAQNNTTTTGNANSSGTYMSVPENNDLSSNVVGLDIYNDDNKDIGTIKDIAMNPEGRTTAYIVSVGGFLGMGDRYIAVNPSAVKVTYSDTDKKWHAKMNATVDQLKAAPEFKYTGRWNGSRT
jgi:sporulation protein YlmC with PRC-barrel domain